MKNFVRLKTSDNHLFDAYVLQPSGKPKGGLVVLQEIFGVNIHIREVCEKFMREGYLTISPCLFDREKKNIELGYTENDVEIGRNLKAKHSSKSIFEIAASINYVKSSGKVGLIGYCWGGSLAYKASCELDDISCSISYYGSEVPKFKSLPKCSVMCHFGELDKGIPLLDVNNFINKNPSVKVFTYPADHGFNCNHRSQYDEVCSRIAYERTLNFLNKNIY